MAQNFVVMGVSGSGKSSLGQRLATTLGLVFLEGDRLHSPENVAKMAAGIPLTDQDRSGWLHAVAERLAQARANGPGLVAACSALKRGYRDILRAGDPDLRLVFLHGDPRVLAQRMDARTGHYMPASLLASQLATLEPPGPDEQVLSFDVTQNLDSVVAAIVAAPPP